MTEQEQPCELRSLNVCDGAVVHADTAGLAYCLCASAELADEVGWVGAAGGWRKHRDDIAAAMRRHPASRPRPPFSGCQN